MHLEQRLSVRLSQRLIMTPSLQQAIKLLQMSKLEPVEYREELPPYEHILTRQQTISEHLLWQLDMARVSPLTQEIGRAIIGNLDEDGFLRATMEELQQMGDYPEDEVRRALEVVREF